MLTFVPSLGTGEVFAFGAGVPLPTRMKFREVPVALRPTSEAGGNTRIAAGASPDRNMIDSVIDRWRAATMSKGQVDDDGGELGSFRDDIAPLREEVPRYQPRRRATMQPRYAAAPPLQPAMQPPRAYAAPRLRRPRRPRAAARRASRSGRASCAVRCHRRSRSARTIRRRCPAAIGRASRAATSARAPKIALPTRTCVAPMAMAMA